MPYDICVGDKCSHRLAQKWAQTHKREPQIDLDPKIEINLSKNNKIHMLCAISAGNTWCPCLAQTCSKIFLYVGLGSTWMSES